MELSSSSPVTLGNNGSIRLEAKVVSGNIISLKFWNIEKITVQCILYKQKILDECVYLASKAELP